MAGVQAGRLSIEIVAEIARLQQDLDKAKRAVKAASGDIARSAKAANDNLAGIGRGAGKGIQEFSRDVARLKASMDPAWAALQRYKQQVELLRDAHRQGALTQTQYIQQIRLAKNEFQNAGRGVINSSGAQRAAMQQLSFQLGDVAQGFAMGTRPMTIFAQQSGQVIQALSLMTNSTKGFLGFMAGPWGLVISAAAVVLVPLIAKLFETEDAVKKVEFASYRLGDAQGILGSVMDMTTGKINTQKDALLALARAQILAGQIQARADLASARSALGGLAAPGFNITGGFGGGIGINTGVKRTEAGIVEAFMEGALNAQEAVRGLDSLRKTGLITEDAFIRAAKAVTDFGVAAENLNVFQGAERMLDGRGTAADRSDFLDPAKPDRERKGREGPTAEEIKRRFDDEVDSFRAGIANALASQAQSADEAAEQALRAVEWEENKMLRAIKADEHYNDHQKAVLTEFAQQLADIQREHVEFEKRQQLEQEAAQIADARNKAEIEGL